MARAYQQAAVNGTQVRLVVPTEAVRTVLRLNGLAHLVPMYPTLAAAVAGQPPEPNGLPPAAQAPSLHELLDAIVGNLLQIGLTLQAIHPSRLADWQRFRHAGQLLDQTIHEIRTYVFTTRAQENPP